MSSPFSSRDIPHPKRRLAKTSRDGPRKKKNVKGKENVTNVIERKTKTKDENVDMSPVTKGHPCVHGADLQRALDAGDA